MMKCSKIQEQLYDYLKNRLDDMSYQEVKNHVSICKICQHELEELKKDIFLLDKLEVPEISPEFEKRLRKRIEKRNKLEVILQFIQEKLKWKILHHNVSLIPQPVLARSGPKRKKQSGFQKIMSFKEEFKECVIEGSIEGDKKGIAYIHLKVLSSEGDFIPQVKIILKGKENKKTLTKIAKNGIATLEMPKGDKYSVEVILQGNTIIDIIMDLRN